MCDTSEPEAVGAYLDTSALIDIASALDGSWSPPAALTGPDRRLFAAAHVAFYAHSDRNRWILVSSGVARKEHIRGLALEWLNTLIQDLPHGQDEPGAIDVRELAKHYRDAGLHERDAEHVAEAAARPWIRYFITNDARILQRAPNVDLGHELHFVTVEQAADLLDIRPCEQPPFVPADSNPLSAGEQWWVPSAQGEDGP